MHKNNGTWPTIQYIFIHMHYKKLPIFYGYTTSANILLVKLLWFENLHNPQQLPQSFVVSSIIMYTL